jgi:hypothetical protein
VLGHDAYSVWTSPKALLGHRTMEMTEHYGRLTIDDMVKVAAIVA